MNASRAVQREAISKGKDAAPKGANISAVTPLTDPRMRKAGACACGGGCPRCQATPAISEPGDSLEREADRIANAVMQSTPFVAAALSSPAAAAALIQRQAEDAPSGSSGAADEDRGDAMPDENDAQPLAGNAACPVNAMFSSNVAGGGAKAGCQVPQGQSGAARLAQYIVRGVSAIPPGGLSIGEQFAAIDDPYSISGVLTPVTATTDASGRFDDCYMLASKNALPPDFRLKVAQNHLFGGQPISKNIVTYTAGGVDVRHCKRKPGSCDFSDVCRLA